jgi:hypothetical protein
MTKIFFNKTYTYLSPNKSFRLKHDKRYKYVRFIYNSNIKLNILIYKFFLKKVGKVGIEPTTDRRYKLRALT